MGYHTTQLLTDGKKYAGIGRGHFVEVYEVKKCTMPFHKLKAVNNNEDGYITYPDGQRKRGKWTRFSRMSQLLPSYVEPTSYTPEPDTCIIDVINRETEMKRITSTLLSRNTENVTKVDSSARGDIDSKIQTERKVRPYNKNKPYIRGTKYDKKSDPEIWPSPSVHIVSADNSSHVQNVANVVSEKHQQVAARKLSDPDYTVILAPALIQTASLALPVFGLYTLGSEIVQCVISGL